MKTRLLSCLLLLGLAACGGTEAYVGIDPVTGEGVEATEQHLIADDLYAKLREAEGLMTMPLPQQTVLVGTLSSGYFTGLTTTWVINPITRKPQPLYPSTSIGAIDAVLLFRTTSGQGLSVTVNGKTVSSTGSEVSINVGTATSVNWTLTSGATQVSDTLRISRAGVNGLGAFTVAALPVSIVYEPPMNVARTNSATQAFRQEMTTITTVSSSQSSTSKPKWATGVVLGDIFTRIGNAAGVTPYVKGVISVAHTLMGSVETSATSGTTVNTDSTLGLTQVSSSSVTTNARLGPGHGDLIVFYKNARVAWAMEAARVSLALIDHGPLVMATVDTLRNDLAAVRAGMPAPVTGLDATSLEGLITLDPMASTSTRVSAGTALYNTDVVLPTPRFRKDATLLINGTTYTNALSHTVTQTDKTSVLNTNTVVKECHPGWLSLVGIGVQRAGTFTTTVSMGTSRTDTVSQTVTAGITLSAGATESYEVEVQYDNVFGTFLTRRPPAPLVVFEGFGP